METMMKKIIMSLLGVALGIATYYFMYGWYDVFPWAVVALIIGYTSNIRRDSIINGSVFGYVLFLVYVFLGYKNKTGIEGMIRFVVFDMLFSLVGAICGAVGAYLGNLVKKRFGKS